MTAELPGQGGSGRLPVCARFGRLLAASAGARSRCRRRQANADGTCRRLPKSTGKPEADGTCRSVQVSPKYGSKPEGENGSSRRLWSFKSETPPEIELKPEVLVKDQSKRGSRKRESTEVCVEAGSAHRSRNLGFRCYCRLFSMLLSIKEHYSISKELSRGPYHICKIKCSRRIFRLSWFQLKGLLNNMLISIVQNITQQPETARELSPDLQKWVFSLNFWVELLFIPIINTTIIGNRWSVTCCRQN